MLHTLKNIVGNALRLARGMDCRILNCYIIEISKVHDCDNTLASATQCLKESLEYELMGFALKDENRLEMWIDPKAHSLRSLETVRKAFGCQNIDCSVHYFNNGPLCLHSPMVNSVSVIIARDKGEETISFFLFDKETSLLHIVPVTNS